MKVVVTESFRVGLVPPGGAGVFEYSVDEARALARDLAVAATNAVIQMEDHISLTRQRGWVPPTVSNGEAVL